MAGGQSTLDFGSGLAQGLAGVFGQKRQVDQQTARDAANRKAEVGQMVLQHLITSGRIANYDDLAPATDWAFGLDGTKKPKKGEITPHDILSQVLQPTFSAPGAAPTALGDAPATGGGTLSSTARPGAGADARSIVESMGQTPPQTSTTSQPGAAGAPPAGAPAAPAAAAAAPGRLRILSDDDLLAKKMATDETLSRAEATRKAARAREFYDMFKSVDNDFSLYDALAMAEFKTDYGREYGSTASGIMRGFDQQVQRKETELGRALTTAEVESLRTDWFAANRSMGTNREAIMRSMYGIGFAQGTPEQQREVIKRETTLLGQQSYSRTAGGNQADFNAPLTPSQAMATSLPVGTTGPQVAGQGVLTQPEIDNRRSTESLRDTLTDIRDRLVPSSLPGKGDLGELAPGAWMEVQKRTPEGRQKIAALEAAVNNVVNVVARTVAQQKGTQTEQDAARAEAAILQLKTSIFDPLKGDTRESATIRINESLRIIDDVLKKLPQQAVPQAGGGASGAAAPADRRARARATLVNAGRQADDATIDQFPKLNPKFK